VRNDFWLQLSHAPLKIFEACFVADVASRQQMQHSSNLETTQLKAMLSLLSLLLSLPLSLLLLITSKVVDLSVGLQLLSLLASSLAVQGQSATQTVMKV